MLKDIITIFYTPLAQVYRAASIGDSISDLQNFVNDLIKTVEDVEERRSFELDFSLGLLKFGYSVSQEDPHRTVQAFIDLIQRHEQSFYHFVHKVHSKGESLFDGLMRWIELFLTVVREGLGEAISLEFLLPHAGQERANILAEVDKVALYHYKLKVAYEGKLRRRFGRAQNTADAEDEATQALVNGVIGEIDFGELMQGDVDDIAAEETNSDCDDDDSSTYESSSNDEDASDDSDGSDDSEESTSESIPKPKLPVRSQTTRLPARTTPRPDTQPPTPRTLTQSLRSSRSMNFLLGRRSDGPNASPPPPVPSLPPTYHHKSENSWSSKPLPPSPISQSSAERPPSPPPPPKTDHEPLNRKAKGKKAETLKPPELQYIPQLLPIFVEIVRPAFVLPSVLIFHTHFRCGPCSVPDKSRLDSESRT